MNEYILNKLTKRNIQFNAVNSTLLRPNVTKSALKTQFKKRKIKELSTLTPCLEGAFPLNGNIIFGVQGTTPLILPTPVGWVYLTILETALKSNLLK